MKIKWGMMMTDGRGKLGGQVASKNRSGAYVRTKVTPVNPRTTEQQAIRSLFGSIASAWRSLTQAQINGWNEATEFWQTTDIFGDLKKPSGFALFQRLNTGLLSNIPTATMLVNAVQPDEIPSVTEVTSEFTAGASPTFLVDWSHEAIGADPEDYVVQLRATPPMPIGRNYHANMLRNVAVGDLLDDQFALTTAYPARFGRFPEPGENVFVEVRVISKNTGRIGTPVSVTTDFI